MYTVTVSWVAEGWKKQVVYPAVMEYEVRGDVLTLGFDENHDLIIPLRNVETVDVLRQQQG